MKFLQKTQFLLLLTFFTCLTSFGQVTIIVNAIPANTPPGDPIYIAGSFNGWDPGNAGYQLTKDTVNNTLGIVIAAGTGTISFKFTRGSWPKVEANANGGFIPDRTFTYGNGDTINLQILGWEDLSGGGGGQTSAAPNVSILSDNVYMPQLNRYRRVWVYVPPDYALNSRTYPVLYMHDGQNVFDSYTSFSGEWKVDETLNDLYASGDSGIIVVAVDNGGGARLDEYSPWVNPSYGGGQGDLYVDFLINTLKPHIDSLYRTRPGRESTGIMGSSMGGLISTYAGIKFQQTFSKVGAFSSAYWFAGAKAYQHITSTGKQADMRIYQLIGNQEGASYVADMHRMEDSLHAAGFGVDEVLSVEKSDGQHSEWFWAREFEAAYIWLYRTPAASTAIDPKLTPPAVRLYPNPVREQLYLKIDLQKTQKVTIEITDLSGRSAGIIFSDTVQAGHQKLTINLKNQGLTAGIYLCHVKAGNTEAVKKFSYRGE
ncbi:MAG: alpha/beta hydrolase-fold protein [Bacteroidia bacterium]